MTEARVERSLLSRSGSDGEPDRFAQCREIRRIVFVEEQSVPTQLEWDGLDQGAEHFLALASAGRDALGTARMRILGTSAKAERVAVLESARNLGIGRLLMEALESRARECELTTVRLNAQVPVVHFYEKLGYRSEGEVFLQAGIEHLAMWKRLD